MEKAGDHRSGNTKKASVDIQPPSYQPTVQEMNEEFDMPGASMETVRKEFFKPLNTIDKSPEKGRRNKD